MIIDPRIMKYDLESDHLWGGRPEQDILQQSGTHHRDWRLDWQNSQSQTLAKPEKEN